MAPPEQAKGTGSSRPQRVNGGCDIDHGRRDRHGRHEIDPLLRTTNRPARSSDNTNRSTAATPTPIPISSAPRRQKLTPPGSATGRQQCAAKRPSRSSPLSQLHDTCQQGRPGRRAFAKSVDELREMADGEG